MTGIWIWGRGAALALLLAPLISSVAVCEPNAVSPGASVQGAKETSSQPASPGEYYVEFRVAQIGTYGHSYVAYGRLNARGQPAEHRFADLHPIGNYALMALGHVFPVPATTKWDSDVEKLPISASWRKTLSAAEYNRLSAAIQRTRANSTTTWNAVTNNCNHYVAELAKAIGLRTPSHFQVSYTFIPALRDLNESARKKEQTDAAKKKQAAHDELVGSR